MLPVSAQASSPLLKNTPTSLIAHAPDSGGTANRHPDRVDSMKTPSAHCSGTSRIREAIARRPPPQGLGQHQPQAPRGVCPPTTPSSVRWTLGTSQTHWAQAGSSEVGALSQRAKAVRSIPPHPHQGTCKIEPTRAPTRGTTDQCFSLFLFPSRIEIKLKERARFDTRKGSDAEDRHRRERRLGSG